MNKINSFLLLKDGAEIAYKIDGKVGPPVALVSGLGGGYQFWNEVSAILSSNYRVISFDQRGIGSSSRGKFKTSLECLVDDFKQLIDHVFQTSRSMLLVTLPEELLLKYLHLVIPRNYQAWCFQVAGLRQTTI